MSETVVVPHEIIRASAGSGKTYALTSRYLRLIHEGHAPQHIVATTFTRKAAGEILGRVLSRSARAALDDRQRNQLAQAIGADQLSPDACRQLLQRLTSALHRVAISTIDSFFGRVANCFRHELQLPVDPRMVDEQSPIAAQLRADAVQAMLAEGDLDAILTLLRRLHHDAAQRSVTQALDDIVTALYETFRESPDEAVWSRLDPVGFLNDAQLDQAVATLAGMETRLPTTGKGTPVKHWANALADAVAAAHGRQWDQLLSVGLVRKIVADEENFSSKPITDDWLAAFEPLIRHARAWHTQLIQRQTHATWDLLRRFDVHYQQRRDEHGLLLYSDVTHRLAHQLPRSERLTQADLYFRMDAHVQHLLLDEFQDTSRDQWRVLEPFADEIAAWATGERTFFAVGDTKQAIYGWRGGCIALFGHIAQQLGVDAKSADRSWRSSQVVLDAVNTVFTNLAACPALAEHAAAAAQWDEQFRDHVAHNQLPGHVLLRSTPAVDHDAHAADESPEPDDAPVSVSPHDQAVAQHVQALRQAAPAATIGVLVAANRTAHRLIFALRQCGVDVSGEGGNPLTDCYAVEVILSALQLAEHPGDTAAAFHVAHSPLGPILGVRPRNETTARAASFAVRQTLLADGFAALVNSWVRRLAPHADARSVTRMLQLVQLAEQFEPFATLRPTHFVDYVRATRVEEPSPARVRVMTIHASKGLEFDAVVLPELNKLMLHGTPVVLEDRPNAVGDVRGIYRCPNAAVRDMVEPLPQLFAQHQTEALYERLCNLYVAMTRARHALHLFVKPLTQTKSGGIAKPGWQDASFAAIVRRQLAPDVRDFQGDATLYETGDASAWMRHDGLDRPTQTAATESSPLHISFSKPPTPSRNWPTASPSSLEGGAVVHAARLLSLERRGVDFGSVIHHWLAMIRFFDDDRPTRDQRLKSARRQFTNINPTQLARMSDDFDRMLRGNTLKAALARPTPRGDRLELWRERDFSVRYNGKILSGTFDRVVIHWQADRPVAADLVDFKTDRITTPEQLAERAAVYQPQLQAYTDALARMLHLPPPAVNAALLFIGSDQRVELATPPT